MKENGDQLPRVQLYTFKLLVFINVKIPKCPGKTARSLNLLLSISCPFKNFTH